MSLTGLVYRLRSAVFLGLVMLLGAGGFALATLPAGAYPEAIFPRITVLVHGGTFEPRDMVVAVTRPMEEVLVGVIDLARVPNLPIRAFKLHVFNRWTAGVGTFSECVRMLAPDQTTVLAKSEMKFQMTNPATNATTVTLFTNVEFASAGTYFIEVLVDDVMKIRYPVNLVVVAPPNQPARTGGTT